MSARTAGELAALVAHVDSIRNALRVGAKTVPDVERELRRLTHGPVTVERAASAYARARSENTAKAVRSFLSVAGGELARLELEQLEAPRLARWIERLRSKNRETSVLRYWRTLRSIVRYAAEQGWISAAPWGMWRPSRVSGGAAAARLREAARNADELEAIFAASRGLDRERADRGHIPFELEAKIKSTALLGLRQGELAGLRWGDFNWAHCRVRIARQYAGRPVKAPGPVTIAVLPELFDVLREYSIALQDRDLYADDGPVFPSPKYSSAGRPRPYEKGQCLSTEDLRAVVARAELPHPEAWSPHSLRDSFATLENEASGGDLEATSKRTRHASIASLVRYLRSRRRELAPAQPITLASKPAPKRRALPPHKK